MLKCGTRQFNSCEGCNLLVLRVDDVFVPAERGHSISNVGRTRDVLPVDADRPEHFPYDASVERWSYVFDQMQC